MTAIPLYVESLEELQQRLRLSGIAGESDAMQMFEEAVDVVRTHFLVALGPERAVEIAKMPLNRQATDVDGMVRLLAAVTETKYVMFELLCTLPVRFAEGNSGRQTWNAEGIWRDKTPELIAKQREKLFNEIQASLEILADGGVSSDQGLQVSVIGPDETPPAPGEFLELLTFEDC